MYKLNKTNKVGRLLALVDRETPKKNLSFFFPVEGLEQWTKLREVTTGLQETSIAYEQEYEFRTFSVADIGRVQDDFHEVDEKQIWLMDLESWIDDKGRFVRDLASQVLKWRLNFSTGDLPDLVVGALAKEKDFFNQEEIITQIWKLVQSGESLLLAGPRRFGKSSLVNELANHSPEGVKACYVDLEKGASAADFVRLILSGLMDRQECRECLPPAVEKLVKPGALEQRKIEVVRGQSKNIEKDWQNYGRDLFERMNRTEGRFLLMLDEFSWLLEEMVARTPPAQEIQAFLDWLDEICLQYNNLSIIFTGSEHLDSYLEAFYLSGQFINNLERVSMRPFDEQTVKMFSFLALFKKEIVVTPSGLQAIIDLMGQPIPYFLQIFLDLLQKECHAADQLSPEDFKDVYFNKLLGRDAKRYFEYINHQIERYRRYGLFTDSVKKLLALLAHEEQIETKELSAVWKSFQGEITFEFLMPLLENDFFVVERGDQLSMECKLLRDYFSLRTL